MAHVSELESTQKEFELCWSQKMLNFEKRLNAVTSPTNPSLQQLREEFIAFKELVMKMIHLLGEQIKANTRTIDAIDMQSRQNILLFHGVSHDPGTSAEQKVLELLQKIGVTQVTSTNFKRCHRLGSGGDACPILVHFDNHRTKAEVWKSKAKLKGSPVSIAEFLTKPRQVVYKRARIHFGIKNVWTMDGTINIKLPDGNRVKVISAEKLDGITVKYPGVLGTSASPNTVGVSSDAKLNQQGVSLPHRQTDARGKQGVSGANTEDSKRSRRPVLKK